MALHGYPDYQPPGIIIPSSGESPVLETVAEVERVGKHVGETLEVGLYSAIRLHAKSDNKNFLILTLEWFTDPELTRPAGKRLVVIGGGQEGSPAGDFQASIVNLGPFLRCTIAPAAGEAAAWTGLLEVIAHNRPVKLEAAVQQPRLLVATAIKGKAGVAINVQPRYYYAGPVEVQAYATSTSTVHQIHVYDPVDKGWVELVSHTVKQVDLWETFAFQVPLGVWRGVLYTDTGGGEPTMYMFGVASATGAS